MTNKTTAVDAGSFTLRRFTAEEDQEFVVWRLRALSEAPYLATVLLQLSPVAAPGLRTFGVDKHWRLYVDPEQPRRWAEQYAEEHDMLNGKSVGDPKSQKVLEDLTVELAANVLLHEVNHALRDHAERADRAGVHRSNHRAWNIAGDAEINDDIHDPNGYCLRLPVGVVLPSNIPCEKDGQVTIGQPNGETAEFYYGNFPRRDDEPQAGECPDCGGSGKADSQPDDSDDEQDGQSGDQQGDQSDSADGSDQQDGDDSNGSSGSDDSDQQDGDAQGSASGTDGDDTAADGSGSDGDQPGQDSNAQDGSGTGSSSDTDERCPTCSGTGSADPTADVGNGDGWGDCGSASDGQKRSYELPGDLNDEDFPTQSETSKQLARRKTAQDINEATTGSKGRGNIPTGLRRWADDFLAPPQVPWQTVLRGAIRQAINVQAGRLDYSYRKPGRRRIPRVITPAMHQPIPKVATIVDTSGSMGADDILACRSEVEGIVKRAGLRGDNHVVLDTDAVVNGIQKVRSGRELVLDGGGGTDMRVGMKVAMTLNPKPNILVILTDGFTPWPEKAPAGRNVIIGIVGDPESFEQLRDTTPEWAKTVFIDTANVNSAA